MSREIQLAAAAMVVEWWCGYVYVVVVRISDSFGSITRQNGVSNLT